MKVVQGDLIQLALAGHFDAIIHGCNCQCVMGAGIAKAIRISFPEAYTADLATKHIKPELKLGSYTAAEICRQQRYGKPDVYFHVVNAYTQLGYGAGVQVSYTALARVLDMINYSYKGCKIAYPKIGAGLGGGKWSTIETIIDECLTDVDHTLVEYVR